ncbi:MAG TPA: hypothetical protein VFA26_09805, partial [Gemmataceae bacterium]|nr:hypothetical protein [Gemmataceae bacterium]
SVPFVQLAALVPESVLLDILGEYGRVDLVTLLVPPDRVLRNVERAVAVEQYIRSQTGNPPYRHDLVGALRYAGDEERALKEARRIMEQTPPVAADDAHRLALQQAVWGLQVLGRPREALEMLDRWLYTAPGTYRGPGVHVMLVDRARLHAALGEPGRAEEDLREYYRLAAQESVGKGGYNFWAGACLIEGFLKEDRGDPAGARAAWERGLWSAYPRPGGKADAALQSPLGRVYGLILGSLAGKLADAEVREFLQPLLAGRPGERASPASLALKTITPPTSVFAEMWRAPRGRQWARRFAFKDLPYADSLRVPPFLAAGEYLHQTALPGPLSREHDDLIWDTVRGVFAALLDGKLTDTQVITLGLGWKAGLSLDVEKALPGLDPSLHAAFAYLYGHRLLQKKDPSGAAKMFAAAVKLAPAQAPVRKLARAELDRLKQMK